MALIALKDKDDRGPQELITRGRWIFAAWKHVRRYDATAQTRMAATAHAGRACDLLGRLRMLQRYETKGLVALAGDAGISPQELTSITLPALEAAGGLQRQTDASGAVVAVLPLAVDQDDVMSITQVMWEAMLPGPDERAALKILEAASELPRTATELMERCTTAGLDEVEARRGLELAVAVGLARRRLVADIGEDLFYNEYLWGDSIERTADALGRLRPQMKEGLVSLLDELHEIEGRPMTMIESANPDLVRFAAENGIIEQTDIVTVDGRAASFSFTRMRGFGVAKDDLPDELDQIRLVIASFQFAKHHAVPTRLDEPVGFLTRLVEDGTAGRAKPIGTDYGALEKQQIVATEPIFTGAWAHRFVELKPDALVAARGRLGRRSAAARAGVPRPRPHAYPLGPRERRPADAPGPAAGRRPRPSAYVRAGRACDRPTRPKERAGVGVPHAPGAVCLRLVRAPQRRSARAHHGFPPDYGGGRPVGRELRRRS